MSQHLHNRMASQESTHPDTLTAAEIAVLDGATAGTQVASKAVVADTNVNTGIAKVTALHIGTSGSEVQVTASPADLNAVTNFEETISATTSEVTIATGKTIDVADDGGLKLNSVAISSTAAELNLLDGTVVGNTVASKVPLLDAAKALRTNANVGTAGTNVTAVEYGDGYNHVTVLTLTAASLTPTIPADAEGAGAIIYTFPAGVYVANACHMDITAIVADSATNAADLGVGSLISSGDIATLTTAAMEDWVTGQTVADISSPATEKSTIMTGGAPLLFEAGGSHVAHINIAGTWNATVSSMDVTGTITLYWTFLGA
ncbi:MAG: hypothetical protein V3U75_13360 [Methylococcaceae bacterium]